MQLYCVTLTLASTFIVASVQCLGGEFGGLAPGSGFGIKPYGPHELQLWCNLTEVDPLMKEISIWNVTSQPAVKMAYNREGDTPKKGDRMNVGVVTGAYPMNDYAPPGLEILVLSYSPFTQKFRCTMRTFKHYKMVDKGRIFDIKFGDKPGDLMDINWELSYNGTGSTTVVPEPETTATCRKGRYGDGCKSRCWNCRNDRCHAVTGECEVGCKRGYTGKSCWTPCQEGTWGFECKSKCSKKCLDGLCNPKNGKCKRA